MKHTISVIVAVVALGAIAYLFLTQREIRNEQPFEFTGPSNAPEIRGPNEPPPT